MIDTRRAARAVVLTAWSVFLAYLWVSGDVTRYLGPRTYWVAVAGALTLGAAALAHLFTLRSRQPSGLTAREIAGLMVILSPILLVLAVPRAELGALAAAKKSTGVAPITGFAQPVIERGAPIGFIDIAYAERSPEYAAALGLTEGQRLDLLGFVSRSMDLETQELTLTRFYVSCCAADAIPYSVEVDVSNNPGTYSLDQWLKVSGTVTTTGDGYVVRATAVKPVEAPKNPYLY